MTQKEKAEAYDGAIEKAKKELNTCGSQDCDAARQIFRLFPELAESDEKIRKALIKGFNECLDSSSYPKNAQKYWHGIAIEDIFAWLEKQGEPSDKIHYWTEEEIEPIISDYLRGAEHYGGMIGRLRCLKPKSLEKQDEKSLTVDIESMIEAYEQRLINQGNGVRNSPIVNMCVAAFKHGVENTLDELHLKQGETSPILSNSSNIGKDEQKPAWSCEDETRLQACIDTLQAKSLMGRVDTVMTNWLKSLKNRIKGE